MNPESPAQSNPSLIVAGKLPSSAAVAVRHAVVRGGTFLTRYVMPHYYFSGSALISGMEGEQHKRHIYKLNERITHRLFSLHKTYKREIEQYLEVIDELRDRAQTSLMLDSGAFTAFKQREPDLSLDALCATIDVRLRETRGFREVHLINLDKIPGQWGRSPTQEELEAAVEMSDENYQVMRARYGDAVLPVFHQTESREQLDHILDYNCPYICISPRKDKPQKEQFHWAQRVIEHCGKSRRVHGLGVTGKLTSTSPYYSIDSATSVMLAVYGKVNTPDNGGLSVSSKNYKGQRQWSQAFDARPDKRLTLELCAELGITAMDLKQSHSARILFNTVSIQKMLEGGKINTDVQGALFEF